MSSINARLFSYRWIIHPLFAPAALFLCFAALTYMSFSSWERLSSVREQKNQAKLLYQRSILSQRKRGEDELLATRMKGASIQYLEKHLQALPLLTAEINKWRQVSIDNPSIQAIENRIKFLKGDQNSLRFKKSHPKYYGPYMELQAVQSHPVEVNEEDLKKILSSIEGIKIGRFTPEEKRPQCIIEKFDLKKSTHPELKEKVFILSMELTERHISGELFP